MANDLTNYAETALLTWAFRPGQASPTRPTSMKVCLLTAETDIEAGTLTEASYTGYGGSSLRDIHPRNEALARLIKQGGRITANMPDAASAKVEEPAPANAPAAVSRTKLAEAAPSRPNEPREEQPSAPPRLSTIAEVAPTLPAPRVNVVSTPPVEAANAPVSAAPLLSMTPAAPIAPELSLPTVPVIASTEDDDLAFVFAVAVTFR
jgi:hypothetical protein